MSLYESLLGRPFWLHVAAVDPEPSLTRIPPSEPLSATSHPIPIVYVNAFTDEDRRRERTPPEDLKGTEDRQRASTGDGDHQRSITLDLKPLARLRADAGANSNESLWLLVDERGLFCAGFRARHDHAAATKDSARAASATARDNALQSILAMQPSRAAPLLLRPQVLDDATCEQLIETLEASWHRSGQRMDGSTSLQTLPTFKWRRDHSLSPGELHDKINRRLAERVLPAIEQAFAFRVSSHEGFKIVAYDAPAQTAKLTATEGQDTGVPFPAAGHFARHRDNRAAGTQHRQFALSLGLNDRYHGGRLVFPEFNDDGLSLTTGEAVVFSASLLHAVEPVTLGTRYALITFLW
ncbi:MAG: 2OG-Fe(II) oxygenase [Thioalkalivibrionaceae bacterium]